MSANCGDSHCSTSQNNNPAYRRVLWICLIANAVMFLVQIAASYAAHSVSLLANSLDFLSDAANYGISIFVLNLALHAKAKASMFKGISMGLLGLWAAYETIMHAYQPELPKPLLMTLISIVALGVNVFCTFLLYKFRDGDSNAESVWLCSRNDAIGNVAVMLAAGGVYLTHTVWPDIAVAALLAWLALHATYRILTSARKELSKNVSVH